MGQLTCGPHDDYRSHHTLGAPLRHGQTLSGGAQKRAPAPPRGNEKTYEDVSFK